MGHGGERQRIADYTLVRLLGQGNHGWFYLAVPPARVPHRHEYVAVKLLAGPAGTDGLRRMTRELQVFAAVRSPYLVKLLDAGQDGDTCYYAMEYYPRGSLASPAQPLERDARLAAVADAARGAHALHEAGVVHRDIKPANVLLDDSGARLSDLGLVQAADPVATATGMASVDAIEYVDPEVVRGARASRASDIWALGVTLHRVLTGASLYGQIPTHDALLAMRHVLKTPTRLDPSLRPAERTLVADCLAPSPQDRPTTAEHVARRIDALREG